MRPPPWPEGRRAQQAVSVRPGCQGSRHGGLTGPPLSICTPDCQAVPDSGPKGSPRAKLQVPCLQKNKNDLSTVNAQTSFQGGSLRFAGELESCIGGPTGTGVAGLFGSWLAVTPEGGPESVDARTIHHSVAPVPHPLVRPARSDLSSVTP